MRRFAGIPDVVGDGIEELTARELAARHRRRPGAERIGLGVPARRMFAPDRFLDFRAVEARQPFGGECYCLPENHLREVIGQLRNMKITEASVKERFATTLKCIRAGKADPEQLWGLLKDIREHHLPPASLPSEITNYTPKVELIESLTSKGAVYIGYNGHSLDVELAKNKDVDIYTLDFNEETRRTSDMWPNILAILQEKLEEKKHVVLVDCDVIRSAIGLELNKPVISLWRRCQIVTNDVAKEQQFLATSIMRYNEDAMDREFDSQRPVRCASVKIPCPSSACTMTTKPSWICLNCRSAVAFGFVDKFFYCECGRCDYRQWEFRCANPNHGLGYMKYDEHRLLKHLEVLESFPELNILILGQIGVGKSTWINAFFNYLTFSSLDEAMKEEKLEWLVPSSFSMQRVNEVGELTSVKIQVGFPSQDEFDGSAGQSGTQMAQVYPMLIGNHIVRIIDISSLGDTRGFE